MDNAIGLLEGVERRAIQFLLAHVRNLAVSLVMNATLDIHQCCHPN